MCIWRPDKHAMQVVSAPNLSSCKVKPPQRTNEREGQGAAGVQHIRWLRANAEILRSSTPARVQVEHTRGSQVRVACLALELRRLPIHEGLSGDG
jgi:hypothetical protein